MGNLFCKGPSAIYQIVDCCKTLSVSVRRAGEQLKALQNDFLSISKWILLDRVNSFQMLFCQLQRSNYNLSYWHPPSSKYYFSILFLFFLSAGYNMQILLSQFQQPMKSIHLLNHAPSVSQQKKYRPEIC